MGGDIQRPLVGLQSGDDSETGLINGTLGFLGVFEGDSDLITELRAFVLFQLREGLREVILEEVEKFSIIIFGHTAVL